MKIELKNEILHEKSAPVLYPLQRGLIRAMFRLLREERGIGLAAPQIGLSLRFFITNVPHDKPRVFINPKIIDTGYFLNVESEGCLSCPGVQKKIRRASWVDITAIDQHGQKFSLRAFELLARCIQHEYDHLEGILITDKRQA